MLLRRISVTDPHTKTIVFSQWQGVLQIVSVGLVTNEIAFADAFSKGGRQQDKEVQTFKASSDVNVLLLATKSGANGLNLTEATNVVLVEPVMSPAVEAQAVSRVLRIGQTKHTHVYRLIVTATIEEQIVKMQKNRRVAQTAVAGGSPTRRADDDTRVDITPRRARRGAEDQLTVADLRRLFAGHVASDSSAALHAHASGRSAAIDLSSESDYGQLVSEQEKSAFWKATVVYNKRDVPRADAANAITML